MPEINYLREKFKENVQALKTKKYFRANAIANLLGINKSTLSRYINPKIKPPGDDTLNSMNYILEEKLKEILIAQESKQAYEVKIKEQTKDIRAVKISIDKLNKKADRIIALLQKKG